MMLRTMTALAKIDGRVCAFLEPIALYMTKDLYEPGDGLWQAGYPSPERSLILGEERVQHWAQQGLKVNTVYPSLVYGPPGKKQGANTLLRALLLGRFLARRRKDTAA